jgi:hypothetical protein
MQTRQRTYLISTLVLLTICSTALSTPARVKYVHLTDSGPFGEPPYIEVLQSTDADGLLRYTHTADAVVHFVVKVDAKCKVGYHLNLARMKTGWDNCQDDICEAEFEPVHYQEVAYPKGRTVPEQFVDFVVPLDVMHAYGFDPIALGNASVAEQTSHSIQEKHIRAHTWTSFQPFPIAFQVRCASNHWYTGLDKWFGTKGRTMDVVVRYVGKDASGFDLTLPEEEKPWVRPQLPGGPTVSDQVTITPYVLAQPSPDPDTCTLHLWALFTTNGKTTIAYQVLDHLGSRSPLFWVPVDHTHTASVQHVIDLREAAPEGLDLVSPTAPPDAIDQLASAPTDQLQGFYQLEVVAPYHVMSNIASYNIEPCPAQPAGPSFTAK